MTYLQYFALPIGGAVHTPQMHGRDTGPAERDGLPIVQCPSCRFILLLVRLIVIA